MDILLLYQISTQIQKDFDIGTQGESIPDAMEMARDAIGILGIEMEDEGEQLPKPFSRTCEKELGDQEALIDIDFEDYRKKHDNRTVKKNCTIPYYLNAQAEKAGINFSRLLQDALKRELSC